MLEIREVDVHDDAALKAWHAAVREGESADRVAPLVFTYESMAASFRKPGATMRRLPVAAVRGDETVGALLIDLPLREDTHTAVVEINVPPARRGQGVGEALWQWSQARTAVEGRSVLSVEVNVPAGRTPADWAGARFAERRGFSSVHVENHFVRSLPAPVPPAAVPEGYELVSWAGRVPGDQLASLAAMRTTMSQDVPSGDAEHETTVWDADRVRVNDERMATGYLSLVSLVRTTEGEPAGYTQILVPRDDPDNALQEDTFVARKHRGRRLSAGLKSANLELLAVHAGSRRFLHTWTGEDNTAMLRVNRAYGFQPVERTHTYQRGHRP
ncbi:GNAT family N-acetyltransferase [Paractinoplanes abujensis]|uniref:GNAT superfamily N-acetyltransferase n=1 Tax=Paractinoplanes abujensis TaxID=882441 RepID=A0A7W7CTF0_9ACTN|nr:GNAT family N-acetyltransferase [Actinoplanes abujensis]MBB4692646.1 GNAT superfamily N-acetyltransferase [Actinoplanes abujensis]